MKLTPWLVFLSMCLVACSGSKSAQKVNEESPQIELSDADEFIENPSADTTETADTEAAVDPTEDVAATEAPAEVVDEAITADSEAPVVEEVTVNASPEVIESTPSSHQGGSMMQYTVQKNETLMMVAFKLYGDYGKWKDLASQNSEALKGSTQLRAGMVLSYTAPAEEFVWNPQGLPYLIRTGDTLGTISGQVYQTTKKWKMIWENNRPLIKDPNRIFAGFTIYYLENGREVAAEI